MGQGWGDPSGKAMAMEGGASKAPTGPLMRFTEARNENPPDGGLTRAGELPYAEFAVRVIVNLHGCSSRVKHPITQPLDMGQICQRRAGRLDRAAYRLPKRSGPKNRGYTGI